MRPRWIHAAPFREHLLYVSATTGVPTLALGIAVGVRPHIIRRLADMRPGRELYQLPESAARSIMSLDPATVITWKSHPVSAELPSQHARILVARGCSPELMAERLGWSRREVRALLDGQRSIIDKVSALKLAALVDINPDQPVLL